MCRVLPNDQCVPVCVCVCVSGCSNVAWDSISERHPQIPGSNQPLVCFKGRMFFSSRG